MRFYFFNFCQNRIARSLKFIAVHYSADAEKSRQTGAVSPRIHMMNHALLFAHLLEEARTASTAEQNGEHIQHRYIGVAQFRDMPGKMDMTQFHRRFLDDF